MSDANKSDSNNKLNIRHMGRIGQINIYFGKLIRMFVYQSDWITIPMAAFIAGLISLALGSNFGVSKEGTMMGIFALVCVCLWNGMFNSIQVICRERDVIKREHRSGMHISSYIVSHMMYQAFMCFIQTVVTLFTCQIVGMRFYGEGLFTPFLIVDVGICIFLSTYAADMLALFISSVVRSTTIAMTVMPFVLIFEMVFSGGLFPIPNSIAFISKVTVSNPAFDSISSLMDLDNRPLSSLDSMFDALQKTEIDVSFKGSDILDMLSDESNDNVRELRDIKVSASSTVGEVCNMILNDNKFSNIRNKSLNSRITVGDVLDEIAYSNNEKALRLKSTTISGSSSIREAMNYMLTNESMSEVRNEEIINGITIGQLFSGILAIGEDVDIINDTLDTRVEGEVDVDYIIDFIRTNDNFRYLNNVTLMDDMTIGEALSLLMNTNRLKDVQDTQLTYDTTVGEVVDYLRDNDVATEYKDRDIILHVKFSEVIDKMGKDNIKNLLSKNVSMPIMLNGNYTHSTNNVMKCWLHLLILIAISSIAAIISLEFIDKDKR